MKQPTELTANINPCEHGFVTKTQALNPMNVNEFTVPDFLAVIPVLMYQPVKRKKQGWKSSTMKVMGNWIIL